MARYWTGSKAWVGFKAPLGNSSLPSSHLLQSHQEDILPRHQDELTE